MTAKLSLFDPNTSDELVRLFAQHLVGGRAWCAGVDGTVQNCIAHGTVEPLRQLQQEIQNLAQEFNINTTTKEGLLTSWETSVGLPNKCIKTTGTLSERRERVLRHFKKNPIVTLSDFQNIIDEVYPDYNVTIYPGSEYYSFEYEFGATGGYQFGGNVNTRFVLVIEYPASNEFEYTFGEDDGGYDFTSGPSLSPLACFIKKFLPACCVLVFIETYNN